METVLIFSAVAFLYFAPSLIAVSRGIKSDQSVFVVNFFLGWTFIGWVVALAWAVSGEPVPKRAKNTPPDNAT